MYELFSYNKNFKYCSFNLVSDEKNQPFQKNYSHYPVLYRIFNMMQERGFKIGRDPQIEKHFKCLTKDHWYGRKGALEFTAERYPRGFKIEFFQNIVFENKAGGKYDFDKYDKMPYLIRLTMINTLNHIEKFVNSMGITKTYGRRADEFKTAEEKIKFYYMDEWHHLQENMNFDLYESKHNEPDYNCHDRDGKRIENGQVKYFRGFDGRLRRGIVFHNINNMWWVILNKYGLSNEADFRLFDPTPKDLAVRRLVQNRRRYDTLIRDKKAKPGAKYYFIWSRENSDRSHLTFWSPGFAGYTTDLNRAGVFTMEQVAKTSYKFDIITAQNVAEIKARKDDNSYLIAVDDVQLLGQKVVNIVV